MSTEKERVQAWRAVFNNLWTKIIVAIIISLLSKISINIIADIYWIVWLIKFLVVGMWLCILVQALILVPIFLVKYIRGSL